MAKVGAWPRCLLLLPDEREIKWTSQGSDAKPGFFARNRAAHIILDLVDGLSDRTVHLSVVRARSNAGTRLAAGPAQRVAREAGLMPCAHEDAPALDMRLDGGHVGIVGTHAGRSAREQHAALR